MSGCHVPIECHCKCHVSQNECCDACPSSLAFKIKDLESLIHAHWDLNYKSDENLAKRINGLEKENEMRINTIACVASAYDEACCKIEKRLEQLESSYLTIDVLHTMRQTI